MRRAARRGGREIVCINKYRHQAIVKRAAYIRGSQYCVKEIDEMLLRMMPLNPLLTQ